MSGDTAVRETDLEAAHSLRRTSSDELAPRRIPRWWVAALVATVVASWWLILSRARGGAGAGELGANLRTFLDRLAGRGLESTPAFRESERWLEAGELAVDTVAMSVIATGLAGGVALVTIGIASRRLTTGDLAVLPAPLGAAARATTRAMYVVSRSIPEYLWALLVVFALRPGILTGAIALALHNVGVMGRLGADLVDDLDDGALSALRSTGASTVQTVAYGVLPQLLPQLITFLLYRWEVMIRASAVVGFVTAAGLGYELRLALSRFDYTWIATILVAYVALTFAVDLASAGLRRLAR